MYDIILISVPFTIIETPPLGIAVLKGAVESAGFRAKTIDLGMQLFNACQRDKELFDSLQEYFIQPGFDDNIEIKNKVSLFIDAWASELATMPSRYIGISVFSYYSHLASYLLIQKIKEIDPTKKIVVGGPGVSIKISGQMQQAYNITAAERLMSFGEILKKRKLAEYITGDGEQALIDLLTKDQTSTEFQMLDYQSNQHPFANFDDFNLYEYSGQLNRGYPQIPIFSSKGCVRNCDFCDVNSVQNRFRFRAGKNIVEEMLYLADRYGIRDFNFLDSLVNGSLKSMLEWITALAEYNNANPDKKITWSGSWICRPIGQIKEHVYKLLADSGCQALSIGAESGSNNVLNHMGKKTNVEALYYEAEQFAKHNIKFSMLIIVGHWSETWEDFLKTCDLIVRLAKYARTGNLISVNTGIGFMVIDDTPATNNREVNRLEIDNYRLWWTSVNPGLTAKERYYRVLLLDKLILELNIPPYQDTVPIVYWELKSSIDSLKDFYKSKTEKLATRPENFAGNYHSKFNEFMDLLIERNFNTANSNTIKLELETSLPNDTDALIEIMYNDTVLYTGASQKGIQTLEFTDLDSSKVDSTFSIRFFNKTMSDTTVDAHGNILQDKYILINKFIVNDVDLMQDIEFFYNRMQYSVDGTPTDVSKGFWLNNSKLVLNFSNPFILWYCHNTTTHAKSMVYIVDQLTVSKNKLTRVPANEYNDRVIEILNQMEY
jgi:hypothetical protein